ncbi:Protein tyrosine phosphatase [Mactra antiquata]
MVCPQGTFGEQCEYRCHCPVGTECDPLTGQCPDGCAPGWSGAPYCQSENVALNKKTYQHGTYMGWNSTRAVDGNPDQDGTYGSCAWAHNSDDVFKTWWNVDLGRKYHVQSLEIYFRTDDAMSQSRRAGIRVYVSDRVEEAKNEGLCYIDQMSDFVFPPAHLILRDGSLACTQRSGRFVILYVDRPTQTPIRNCPSHTLYSCWANLELCEVLVYSCTNGTYGDLCEKRCHCENNVGCHPDTGECQGDCQPGWKGLSCNERCMSDTYGINCNSTCGHCSDPISSCNRITGYCKVCQPGWIGERCDRGCDPGHYGQDCKMTCGNCLGTCDTQTGVCSLGCKPGWVGSKCIEVCREGTYGPSCESSCSNCRNGASCHHVTGNCPEGCADGFTGQRCNKDCAAGTYGENCLKICGKCMNNATCDHVTGNCPSGCEHGYKGNSCEQICSGGYYGNQCSGECGFCRNGEPCDHVTGVCTNGCEDGWSGEKCKNRCAPGHYGTECAKSCGACSNGEPCNHVTGVCTNGCGPGWQGTSCDKACTEGQYGNDCSEKCGHCKNNTACNHVDGICSSGCQPEYYGDLCTNELQIPGERDIAGVGAIGGDDLDLSLVIGGVLGGVLVVFIGIVLFVVIRRRKNNQQPPPSKPADRRNNHTSVAIIVTDDGHNTIRTASATHSPTPSRASSHATIKTNCTQSHVTVDDQEVLYVNLKKKNPTPLPLAVPSPKLSTFQRKVMQNGTDDLEPTYYNTREELDAQSTNLSGVPVQDFSKYIKEMENEKTRFKEQFSQYPHGLKYPYEAGKRPRNKFKNRFAQMFPYDHSRVVLDDDPTEPDSDYINANFIDSVDYPNCYIATQGPNKITLKDFWQMVWQNKCGKIVMLTNLVEESKNKCERYWPNDRVPMTFGDLQVTSNSSQEYPFYTLRVLTITSEQVCRTNMLQLLTQIWFPLN